MKKHLFFLCALLCCVQSIYAQSSETRIVTCFICSGTGHCRLCAGSGYIYSVMGMTKCFGCWGTGKCSSCHGLGHHITIYNPNIDYTNGSTTNGNTTTNEHKGYQTSKHQCKVCGGTGIQIKEKWMGGSSTKWCETCKKQVYVTHQHVTCSNCQGKGYSEY